MLKKRLGIEAIEINWRESIQHYFKIPSILIIPEGVEGIGVDNFSRCSWLEKVIIPKSARWIGQFAFWCCYEATIILKKPRSEFKFIGLRALDDCKEVIEDVKEEVGD